MSIVGPNEVEIRILGCLVEKQKTTPDHYPLTLNALQSACNQSTNRDPVVSYEEAEIREALGRLTRRRWIRSASGHSGRVPKYRHLLEEELALSSAQLALLTVMMLRGPQTPGELKQRAERLHGFESLDEVHTVLESLIERDLAERLPRSPGQKEERYRQLLGGRTEDGPPAQIPDHARPTPTPEGDRDFASVASPGVPADAEVPADAIEAAVPAIPPDALDERLRELEAELGQLKRELAELRSHLGLNRR